MMTHGRMGCLEPRKTLHWQALPSWQRNASLKTFIARIAQNRAIEPQRYKVSARTREPDSAVAAAK